MRKILIALIVSGALLVLGGVILGYYYPIVGNIVGIIGLDFNLLLFYIEVSIWQEEQKVACKGISLMLG